MMGNVKYCPIPIGNLREECIKDECAWWDNQNEQCGMIRAMGYGVK